MNPGLSLYERLMRKHPQSSHETIVTEPPRKPEKRGMTREDVKYLSTRATAALVWEIAKLHPQRHEVIAIFLDLAEDDDEERERFLDKLIRDLIRDVDSLEIERHHAP